MAQLRRNLSFCSFFLKFCSHCHVEQTFHWLNLFPWTLGASWKDWMKSFLPQNSGAYQVSFSLAPSCTVTHLPFSWPLSDSLSSVLFPQHHMRVPFTYLSYSIDQLGFAQFDSKPCGWMVSGLHHCQPLKMEGNNMWLAGCPSSKGWIKKNIKLSFPKQDPGIFQKHWIDF